MNRCTIALLFALVAGCNGQKVTPCTAYDAAREGACEACSRMQAPCPFPE